FRSGEGRVRVTLRLVEKTVDKVAHLYHPALNQQTIIELQPAMDNVMLMRVVESFRNLPHDAAYHRWWKGGCSKHWMRQRALDYERRHQVGRSWIGSPTGAHDRSDIPVAK